VVDGRGGLEVEIVHRQDAVLSLAALFLGGHLILDQEITRGFDVDGGDIAKCQRPGLQLQAWQQQNRQDGDQ
jgi:hypothetical protein